MKMLNNAVALALALTLLSPAMAGAEPGGRRGDQDAARRSMLDGGMPFSTIKRRVDSQMSGATYLGSEFNAQSNRYRLKYLRDGKVVWVDADGRTGDITGWAR
ncbi:MAG: hypothetical protein ABW039_09245 [Sphingobium sp.]